MRYRSIALSGGGMRGAAHVGALRAIQEVQGCLEFPDGIYGSSVGSILAAAVAFNISLDTIQEIFPTYHKRSEWLPALSVTHAFGITGRRGVFTMDRLRATLVTIFTACGIKDIETKRICDTNQPLFIVASNLTTRRPAILTGEVPLIQAILCSCCIPVLFEPQVLYGDVYLDSAVYIRNIEQVSPPGSLVIQLFGNRGRITSQSSMSDILSACYFGKDMVNSSNHVCKLKDLNVGVVDDITQKEREEVIEKGYSQTLAFLTKMAAKKRH
jgi:NTE family protein